MRNFLLASLCFLFVCSCSKSDELQLDLGLQDGEIPFIQQTFGELDFENISYPRIGSSDKTMTSVPFISNNEYSNKRLLIIEETNEAGTFNIAYVISVTSNNKSLTNLDEVTDGEIDLYCLEKGFHFNKKIVENVTLDLVERNYETNFRVSSFGSCFKSCVANNMKELNWVEAAACMLQPEACAAAFLIGCTAYCTIGPGKDN